MQKLIEKLDEVNIRVELVWVPSHGKSPQKWAPDARFGEEALRSINDVADKKCTEHLEGALNAPLMRQWIADREYAKDWSDKALKHAQLVGEKYLRYVERRAASTSAEGTQAQEEEAEVVPRDSPPEGCSRGGHRRRREEERREVVYEFLGTAMREVAAGALVVRLNIFILVGVFMELVGEYIIVQVFLIVTLGIFILVRAFKELMVKFLIFRFS